MLLLAQHYKKCHKSSMQNNFYIKWVQNENRCKHRFCFDCMEIYMLTESKIALILIIFIIQTMKKHHQVL